MDRETEIQETEYKMFPFWTIIVILACVAIWLYGAKLFLDQMREYEAYKEESRIASDTTFPAGIRINGVDVSGMTKDEAIALFQMEQNQQRTSFAITLVYGERRWRITSEQVPMSFDTQEVIEQAYHQGHYGTLNERRDARESLAREGADFTISYGFDRSSVSSLVDTVAESIDTDPVNASLDAFDAETHTFSFKEGKRGIKVDRTYLYEEIMHAIDQGAQEQSISVRTEILEPEIRLADLNGKFGLISSFTTETTNDKDRNTNISISASALNGKAVLPGATLSFNSCTGKRTYDKGYREAHAIVGGVLVDDTGGGVCQTSSTLFNAVVRADLEIVTRYAHSWPSIYVPRGEDATVNWPNRDFVFRNSTDWPIFLIAWYEDRKITVEIYGRYPDDFDHIDLESHTIKTIKPSNDVLYTLDETLPKGTRQAGHSKRTGYVVDTYKVYFDSLGNEIKRVKLFTTNYPATQDEIVYH